MNGIVLSDAYQNLQEEVQNLQAALTKLTSERDDLKYHICPELTARYAEAIGDYENRINYQKIMILEVKRRIEIVQAALNREKTVSKRTVDRKINLEYGDFHQKMEEQFQSAERAKQNQKEREQRKKEYQEKWKESYGNRDQPEDSEESEQKSDEKEKKNPNIKDLYRSLIKKLHPDMNPNLTEHEKDLFQKTVDAYKNDDIVILQKIYDEVFRDGEDTSSQKELTYDDLLELREKLLERIEALKNEIAEMKQAFPYNKKDFLDDPDAVEERQKQLEKEIHQNEQTLQRLQDHLQELIQQMTQLKQERNS